MLQLGVEVVVGMELPVVREYTQVKNTFFALLKLGKL